MLLKQKKNNHPTRHSAEVTLPKAIDGSTPLVVLYARPPLDDVLSLSSGPHC